MKELQRFYAPVLVSLAHVRTFCRDTMAFYNHLQAAHRPLGLTRDERDSGKVWQPVLRREALFEGQLLTYRFT